MAERITILFKPDGTAEIRAQGDKGKEMNVERDLQWLWKGLGPVERRGHKPHAHAEEGVQVHGQ